jgi:hypothetical protein
MMWGCLLGQLLTLVGLNILKTYFNLQMFANANIPDEIPAFFLLKVSHLLLYKKKNLVLVEIRVLKTH